jgi:hypothetical protein
VSDGMPAGAAAVDAYLATLDEPTRADAATLRELMQRISGQEPQLWNAGTLGFGTYHYRYASGREGDALVIGFYPRTGKLTIYLMDGTARYAALLERLGPHTLTGYCLYLKRLAGIDLAVLGELLTESYAFITAAAAEGPIDHILWKEEPR